MSDIGLAGGTAPSTPGRRDGATPRRFGPAGDASRSKSAGRFGGEHDAAVA